VEKHPFYRLTEKISPTLMSDGPKFVVLPKRWIVERTFAWLARYRRHSRDYERTPESSEAVTYIAMINLMSKRLAKIKS
jgi:putative transposase